MADVAGSNPLGAGVVPVTYGAVTVSPDQWDGGVLCVRSQSYPMIGNNEL